MYTNNSGGGFKCPACGSDMTFDESTSTLSCRACGHNGYTCVENMDNVPFDFSAEEANSAISDWGEPVQTLACHTCGTKVVVSVTNTISKCSFCGSTRISTSDEPPGIRPELIVPFNIDETKVQELILAWMQKRYLAPFPFKAEYAQGQTQGVYLPYWSFDADLKATYIGQAADRYTDTEVQTVTYEDRTETKKQRVKKLRWRFVSGTLDKNFRNIIFNDAGLDEKIIEKLEPYKLNELVRFSPKHLDPFAAAKAKNGLRTVWQRAQSYMGNVVRDDIYNILKRGSDEVGTINTCVDFNKIAYRQMLLPVWISSYRYRRDSYHVYINGQTGEIFGSSPKSILKIGIIALAVIAVAALLILLF